VRHVVFTALLTQCATPTALHVSVYSDVPCSVNAQALIVGGASLTDLATAAPSSASTQCVAGADGNYLGDVYVAPAGGKSDNVAFELMIRPDGAPADGCSDTSNAAGCIVAKRQIHFSAYTEIDMRIDLRLSCLGVVCTDDSTCVQGQCVPASVSGCNGTCTDTSLLPSGGGASHFQRIAGGEDHTCAITPSGGVKCWGGNSRGQLGNGTNTDSAVPVAVTGLGSGIISVATGQSFSCALTSARTVKCWGKGDYGQLGNNQNGDATTPVDVQSLSDVSSIAAGCKHMCATTNAGDAKCWGWNDEGQIGNGNNSNVSLPVSVLGITSNAAFISAGFHSSCAATATGALCWGDDSQGELGDGFQNAQTKPVAVTQLAFAPMIMVSGAYQGFAYGPTGPQLAAWGANATTGGVSTSIQNASAGDGYTCVLQNGGVLCWGSNNLGQLGSGSTSTTATTSASAPIGLASNVAYFGAGFDHACAVTTSGGVKCWGNNANGELGNGTTTNSSTPVDVKNFP
jgi:alpha-tubulin suppressor-like RCC1 family protein